MPGRQFSSTRRTFRRLHVTRESGNLLSRFWLKFSSTHCSKIENQAFWKSDRSYDSVPVLSIPLYQLHLQYFLFGYSECRLLISVAGRRGLRESFLSYCLIGRAKIYFAKELNACKLTVFRFLQPDTSGNFNSRLFLAFRLSNFVSFSTVISVSLFTDRFSTFKLVSSSIWRGYRERRLFEASKDLNFVS